MFNNKTHYICLLDIYMYLLVAKADLLWVNIVDQQKQQH